jgi:hypothetical protein
VRQASTRCVGCPVGNFFLLHKCKICFGLSSGANAQEVVAVHEMLRELSLLLTRRVKNDFETLLGAADVETVAPEGNKVFMEIVDEVFAWSRTLQEVYGYLLSDERLPHVLLEALLPSTDCIVTQHWLALESAALLGRLELKSVVDKARALAR